MIRIAASRARGGRLGMLVTGTLAVPGAVLYHEVRGDGPVLLIIPTGNGDAAPFTAVADVLADTFTVVTYDRRGFSRSVIEQPVADNRRLDVDAQDAGRLIRHVQVTRHLPQAPADVYSSCSGAIVGLAMLAQRPGQIRTMVVHEPPLASVVPDADRWLAFHDALYDIYRRSGPEQARQVFKTFLGMSESTRPPTWAELPEPALSTMLARLKVNEVYWFEHEVKTFPGFVPDLPRLRGYRHRLVLAGGTTSRDHLPYQATQALAQALGVPVLEIPGGHVGHVTHPSELIQALRTVLGVPTGSATRG
jgi:acetyltransferase/esterase